MTSWQEQRSSESGLRVLPGRREAPAASIEPTRMGFRRRRSLFPMLASSSFRWLARASRFALHVVRETANAHAFTAYEPCAIWTPLAWQAAESGLVVYHVTTSDDRCVARPETEVLALPTPVTNRLRLVSSRTRG